MNTPTEPPAWLRQYAAFLWHTYVALRNEGFTENQAIALIGQMLAANAMGGGEGEGEGSGGQ